MVWKSMERIIIAAMGANRVIGNGGQIPWHLPAELQFFKATTMGHVLLMGRRTWDSIGRPLPGRETVVVSRDPSFSAPGCRVATDLQAALALVADRPKIFIAGGGEIYRQALSFADTILLTVIDGRYHGDTFFPAIPMDQFQLEGTNRHPGSPSYAILTYRRRPAAANHHAKEIMP